MEFLKTLSTSSVFIQECNRFLCIGFYILLLLQYRFIVSRSYLVEFWGNLYVQYYVFCSQLAFLYTVLSYFFIFLAQLLWQELPVLCWIVVIKVNTLIFCLSFEERLSVSFKNSVSREFIVYGLYTIEINSFDPHFVKSFLSWMDLKWSNSFSAVIEMIIWFLFFY